MTPRQKREVIVVGTTTTIGLVSNVVSYALKVPTSKQQAFKFGFAVPKGIELVYVLVTGFVAGIVVNKMLSTIEDSLKTEEEKLLEQEYTVNLEKAKEGLVAHKKPNIVWT